MVRVHGMARSIVVFVLVVGRWMATDSPLAAADLRVGYFSVDASPPAGSKLAYDVNRETLLPLSCRGVVLVGQGSPIILCVVDWIGIANEGHRVFRAQLAGAAGTTVDRVAVHTLHQHDAPVCDLSVEPLLAELSLPERTYDSVFARQVIQQAATAVKQAVEAAVPVTHVGVGSGRVERVASNRRILGPDGKVQFVRWTATQDAAVRAYPAGIIDPMLRSISFWREDQPLVVLTYYATHPQSYYRTGQANSDFPGIARTQREEATGVPHVHFNGAGGNLGAGKWNDGAPENRQALADRLAAGMRQAWDTTMRIPIAAEDVSWTSTQVQLPAAPHLDAAQLVQQMRDSQLTLLQRETAACDLAWLRRCQVGDPVDVACLRLGLTAVLSMPGELFVEYQLAAQRMRPDQFVAMAAYGDYGPGYIGTEIAYSQGGYETTPPASRVAPSVERVLIQAMDHVLGKGSGKQ